MEIDNILDKMYFLDKNNCKSCSLILRQFVVFDKKFSIFCEFSKFLKLDVFFIAYMSKIGLKNIVINSNNCLFDYIYYVF